MKLICLTAALFVAIPAMAEAPTAAEIEKVVSYFYTEGGGPILYRAELCGKVDRKTKECKDPVGDTAKKGTKVELFTHWFAPKGSKFEDIRVEWLHEGETRRTADISVSGALRYRTWKAKNLNKTGAWEVRVRQGDTVLKSFKVTVE